MAKNQCVCDIAASEKFTLKAMNNLAFVLNSQGKYVEAEAMYRGTLAKIQDILGDNHPYT